MKKEIYQAPEVVIIAFDSADIIVTSGFETPEYEFPEGEQQ